MAIQKTVNGGNTTVTLTYTTTTTMIENTLDLFVQRQVANGEVPEALRDVAYGSLTTQQKGDVIDYAVKTLIKAGADEQYTRNQKLAAEQQAAIDAATTIGLG